MEQYSDRVRQLLSELCKEHGLCYASRDPAKFAALVAEGPARFAEEVLLAEGLEPAEHKALIIEVRAHVSFVFDQWGISDDAV